MIKIHKAIILALAFSSPMAALPADSYDYSNTLVVSCFGCHGTDGISRGDHIPTISGLNFLYFYATMQAYKKDRKAGSVMGWLAKGFKTSQLQQMALYFGTRAWTGRTGEFDPELAKQGAKLHQDYCEKCHEQNGNYQDKKTPPLAGQAKGYLLNQMMAYRVASVRQPQPPLMQERLEKLSDADLTALSEFYASKPQAPAKK